MNKKLFAAVLAAAALSLLGFAPAAQAACDSGQTSQVRDADGNPTGEDTVAETPNGSTVYGGQSTETAAGGYVGITGSTGYLELSGADGAFQLQGATNDGAVSGNLNNDGICLNDTTAP